MFPRGLLAFALPPRKLVPHFVRDQSSAVFREQCSLTEPEGVLQVPVRATTKENATLAVAFSFVGVPTGIRTPVCAVKGRCPRPLDDGDCNRHFLLSCVRVTPSSSNTKPSGTRVNHSSPVPRPIARVNPTASPATLKTKPNRILMTPSLCIATFVRGGGKRDRTADLLHAMQALSQLSYTPNEAAHYRDGRNSCKALRVPKVIVIAILASHPPLPSSWPSRRGRGITPQSA